MWRPCMLRSGEHIACIVAHGDSRLAQTDEGENECVIVCAMELEVEVMLEV